MPETEQAGDVRLLSRVEVMKMLQISQTKLHDLIKRKKNPIPSVLIDTSRRFPADKLRSWIDGLER